MQQEENPTTESSGQASPTPEPELQTQVAELKEQVAALRSQLTTPESSSSTSSQLSALRSQSYSPDSIPVYELKQISPMVTQAKEGISIPEVSQDALCVRLLDSGPIQWLMEDWDGLPEIHLHQIENHSQRGRLALYLAVAQTQVGLIQQSKNFLKRSIEWDCSNAEAIRLLMAAAHYNLGKARALKQEGERAKKHLDDTSRLLGFEKSSSLQSGDSGNLLAYTITRRRVRSKDGIKLNSHSVILVAGMRHSGSTALFNIIRLGLEKSGHEFISGYSEYESLASKIRQAGCIGLIKTHEFRDDLLSMADVVFTTRRDLRDTVASAVRREFPILKKLGSAIEYAKYNRSLFDLWSHHTDFQFVYEDFIRNPLESVDKIIEFLGLDKDHVEAICHEVSNLPKDDYQTTLLSESHITDPGHEKSYLDTLSKDDISMINANHYMWLKSYYPNAIF